MQITDLLADGSFWVQGHHTRLIVSRTYSEYDGRWGIEYQIFSHPKNSLYYTIEHYRGDNEHHAVAAFLKSENK